MVGIEGLYFVIASTSRARFVRPAPDDSLHTVRVVDSITVGGDSSGANAPDPNAMEIEPDRFTRLLADRINDDFAVDLFAELVLVAAADVLNDLLALLDGPTSASLVGSLAKDLIDIPDLELWPHLRSWVRPGGDA
jgi:protein required for attachment to host cells